jgi:hypothetical protein
MTRERSRKVKPSSAQTNSDEDREADRTLLSSLEEEWMASRLRGEAESTERLLDDSYRGGTPDGLAQTKAVFLQKIASSQQTASNADHTDRSIQVYGDVAISTGVATLCSPDRSHSFRYLRVFQKRGGEWRLIAAQSARLRGA